MTKIGPQWITELTRTALSERLGRPEEVEVTVDYEVAKRIVRARVSPDGRPEPEPEEPIDAVVAVMAAYLDEADLVQVQIQAGEQLPFPSPATAEWLVERRIVGAVYVAVHQAKLRLCHWLPAGPDPRLDAIADAVFAGRRMRDPAGMAMLRDWVESHLRPVDWRPPAYAERGEGVGVEVSVYLAGALTGLTPEQQRAVLDYQEAVASILAGIGIRAYIPTLHTNPRDEDQPDVSAQTVHQIDYDCVIKADMVVASEYPSTGTGKELAWSDGGRCLTVLLCPKGMTGSRLPRGATARVEELLYDGYQGRNLDDLREFVEGELPVLWAHAIERQKHAERYEPLLFLLRASHFQIKRSLVTDPEILITDARADEMLRSVGHLLRASAIELIDLGRAAQLPVLSLIEGGANDVALSELARLRDVADEEGWPDEEVSTIGARALRRRPTEAIAARELDWRDRRQRAALHHVDPNLFEAHVAAALEGWDGQLPVDLEGVARRLGVTSITDERLDRRGEADWDGTGQARIRLDVGLDPVERRFTLAHELGHIALKRRSSPDAPELEDLCDAFAEHLIVPDAALPERDDTAFLPASLVVKVAGSAAVSPEVAFRRLGQAHRRHRTYLRWEQRRGQLHAVDHVGVPPHVDLSGLRLVTQAAVFRTERHKDRRLWTKVEVGGVAIDFHARVFKEAGVVHMVPEGKVPWPEPGPPGEPRVPRN